MRRASFLYVALTLKMAPHTHTELLLLVFLLYEVELQQKRFWEIKTVEKKTTLHEMFIYQKSCLHRNLTANPLRVHS